MTYNICLSGVGGQGIITAGTIISEAAKISGQNTVMSEIHGLSQRGGSVTVDVRIGECYGPIIPKDSCDLIIGFELMETFRSIESLGRVRKALTSTEEMNPISLSIHDKEYPSFEDLTEKYGGETRVYPVEAMEIARKAGSEKTINVVMIGVALGMNLIPLCKESVILAIRNIFSGKILDINMTALDLGIAWSRRMESISLRNLPVSYEQY